jgi:hypothetical protein
MFSVREMKQPAQLGPAKTSKVTATQRQQQQQQQEFFDFVIPKSDLRNSTCLVKTILEYLANLQIITKKNKF